MSSSISDWGKAHVAIPLTVRFRSSSATDVSPPSEAPRRGFSKHQKPPQVPPGRHAKLLSEGVASPVMRVKMTTSPHGDHVTTASLGVSPPWAHPRNGNLRGISW
ncbi:hypothetical protein BHE74_00005314 [Ensete ventricosum]|nr:hypothetical protein GW17_00014180 [Ensete ventricosum]RWW85976.1 hypothetical protein BHE74_00005314 [Ensete ventricosum]